MVQSAHPSAVSNQICQNSHSAKFLHFTFKISIISYREEQNNRINECGLLWFRNIIDFNKKYILFGYTDMLFIVYSICGMLWHRDILIFTY